MRLEADSKRIEDLEDLGEWAGTGIFVPAYVDGEDERQTVDICTLTDESLSVWLDGLDALALRRTCKVLLRRKT